MTIIFIKGFTNFLYFGITIALIIGFSSCSKTIYTGDTNSFLSVSSNQKIVFLDFTGLELSNYQAENFKHLYGSDLTFVHTYCINYEKKDLSEDCVKQFKSVYKTNYVVVCRTKALHDAKSLHHVTDYETRVKAQRDAGHDMVPAIPISVPVSETTDLGMLTFDIYETSKGKLLSAFGVSVKASGMTIKKRKDYGYMNYNLVPAEHTLIKARRKGLNNIEKRIIYSN